MRMNNFLLDRKSVREYRDKKISRKDRRTVEELADNLADQSTDNLFEFIFFDNGENVYENLKNVGGYEGNMIESPQYIGIKLNEITNEAIVSASFYAEELITELIGLDLGTCWVTIKDVNTNIRANALGEENKNIGYLIAYGYPKPANPFDTVKDGKTSRVSSDEIVFKDELNNPIRTEELELRGLDNLFYYVKFAPSTENSQSWRFVVKNDRVVLYLEEINGKINYMDAGIIMYYFSSLIQYIGLNNVWEFDENLNDTETTDNYKKIAYYLI